MAREFASRTHFVHLRSCHIFPNGDFTEASHLGGRADLIELCRIFESEEANRRKSQPSTLRSQPCLLPFRVDHGRTMLGDEERGYNAGYSFLGRMFAMAQMQGVLATLAHESGK